MIAIQKFMTLVGKSFEDISRKQDESQRKTKENRGTKIRKLEAMFRRLILDNGNYQQKGQKTLGEEDLMNKISQNART